MYRTAILRSLLLAFGLLLAACSPDDSNATDAEEAVETPAGEACEHMTEGPHTDVVASVDPAMAPDATAAHTGVRVKLADVAGGKGGTVTWASDASGELILFTSVQAPVAIATASGDPVTIKSDEAVSECDIVARAVIFDATVGTYRITFGPTTEPTVMIVVEGEE